MATGERKEVVVSHAFNDDITKVYSYGEELFGTVAAKSFVSDIFRRIRHLDDSWRLHPECRHLPTEDKRYRNIILGNYLIIYRIKKESILVLRILHSHSSITKIKKSRSIKD